MKLIDVKLDQKWRVHTAFAVRRNGDRFSVPVGSVLVVKTVPQGCDEFWVTYQGQRFRISQQNMKAKAEPA
jgi:hypothetical protein